MNDGAKKTNESADRPNRLSSNATIELKPQVMRKSRKPVSGTDYATPTVSSDQLAARVTIRRISRGRSERKYVLLLGHRSEITGIERRAYESMSL